jgi:phage baseplate assembly protein W
MPIISSTRRINPLDINKNISIGVAFPLDEQSMLNPKGGTLTVKEQVKTNLINVLLTAPGERIMEPFFGVGLKQLLFEPDINIESLKEQINAQTQLYIPEINITNIEVNFPGDDHILYIIINYDVIDSREQDAIQLNFSSGEQNY